MGAHVLVIGSGGREHALAWKLAKSPAVEKIYVAPGNGGTARMAENVPIKAEAIPDLLAFARKNQIDLTVVGPDAPLAMGIVDVFQDAGLTVFGPAKAAAQIEASKAFSKQLMADQNIPTAAFQSFTDQQKALEYVRKQPLPLVVKASGLALGKGVIICQTLQEAEAAINHIMADKAFGDAGDTVVVEAFLKGQEVSVHAITDGKSAAVFPPSQDHKQIFDGDKGPNTGGIGAFAPVAWVNQNQLDQIQQKVVQPVLDGLRKKGTPFTGNLYPGLMLDGDTINVLEYNARFGDPETQVYMRLLDADLYKVLLACAQGKLNPSDVAWNSGFAVTIVLTSPGYPGDYKTGVPITGIDQAEKLPDIVLFHAGTTYDGKGYKTAGGRVLNITAVGPTLDEALVKAYDAVKLIHFDGMHYRKDIGRRPR